MKKSENLLGNLGLSLFEGEKIDLIESYADMTVIDLLNLGDTLKEIPICRTFIACVNTITTVRDVFLLQKFLKFIKKFQEGTVKEKVIEKRKAAAKNKEQWICREIEFILLTLEQINDKRNVELLCKVYLAFLNEECTWEQFEELALILERYIHQDSVQLKRLYESYVRSKQKEESKVITTMFENNHCDRLIALGLVWQKFTTVFGGGIHVEYCLTEAGLLLASVL